MKKIYLSAYCQGNVGDDLFVLTLLKRYPHIKFYLFANRKACTAFKDEPNLYIVSELGYLLFNILKKLRMTDIHRVHRFYSKRTDGAVKIGGSIFIEPPGWIPPKNKDLFDFGDNAYYIGANFGPYKDDRFLENVKCRLMYARDCCFRDRYSWELFQELPNIRYAPDVLFGYPYYPKQQEGEGIAISIISFEKRPELVRVKDAYYSTLANLCNLCLEKGIPVTLFSFCQAEGDEKAIDEICTKVSEGLQVYKYRGDIEGCLNELNRCQCVIATRFHAMVLGWCLGKRVFPVIYSQKQTHVIEDIKFNGSYWNLLNEKEYRAEDLFEGCMNNKIVDVIDLSSDAITQFSKLEKFLNEEY